MTRLIPTGRPDSKKKQACHLSGICSFQNETDNCYLVKPKFFFCNIVKTHHANYYMRCERHNMVMK